jgi:undecaprenol kinase/diacylglycerol kinase (ATP)
METRKWLRSFRYAYEGLQYALLTQRNLKFHFMVSVIVLLMALIIGVSKLETLFLLLSIVLVFFAEMLNTAIEKTVDLAADRPHPLAKIAKDVAAGAVLVTAVFAVAVGMIVFYEPVDAWIRLWRKQETALFPPALVWIVVGLVLILLVIIQTWAAARKITLHRPSLLAAVAGAVTVLIGWLADSTAVLLLAAALMFMVLALLYEKTERSMFSLVTGVCIGGGVALLCCIIYASF